MIPRRGAIRGDCGARGRQGLLAEERPARQGGREAARRRARSELVLVEQRSRGSTAGGPRSFLVEQQPPGNNGGRPRDRSSWSKNRLRAADPRPSLDAGSGPRAVPQPTPIRPLRDEGDGGADRQSGMHARRVARALRAAPDPAAQRPRGIATPLQGVMQAESRLMRRGRPGPSARPVPRTGRQGRRRPRRPC